MEMEINIVEYIISDFTKILSYSIYLFIAVSVFKLLCSAAKSLLSPTSFLPLDNYEIGDIVVHREDALRSIVDKKAISVTEAWLIIEQVKDTGSYVIANTIFQGVFRVVEYKKITILKRSLDNASFDS
jgi:hypothetical protein